MAMPAAPLRLCRCNQAGDSDQADRAPDVVGERRQAELAPDASQPWHQEGALVHPWLGRAEGVLDAGSVDRHEGRFHAVCLTDARRPAGRTELVVALAHHPQVLRRMTVPFAIASAYGPSAWPQDDALHGAPSLGKPTSRTRLLALMQELLATPA